MQIRDISLQNVHHVYEGNVTALQNLTLRMGTGVFGLLGPNGAGKTTLLRILATLLSPSSGKIRIGPFSLHAAEDRQAIRSSLGYVPQDDPLYPHLHGRECLDYMAVIKRLGSRLRRQEEVNRVMSQMNLENFAHRPVRSYSGGMKRRVAVAQALLGSPQILLADEPMAGLDPQERLRFRTFLQNWGRERVVIISSHILEDIAHLCNQVGVLHRGQLLYVGSTTGLADTARGCVWDLAGELPYHTDCLVLRQGREGGFHRLLATVPPHPKACPALPTLEDGYFRLIHISTGEIRDHS